MINNTQTPAPAYKPQPTDLIVCDPEFSPEKASECRVPIPIIPARVLEVFKNHVKVEILDEWRHGKRIYTNTDLYGSTCYVLISAIQKSEK